MDHDYVFEEMLERLAEDEEREIPEEEYNGVRAGVDFPASLHRPGFIKALGARV